ncbi:MAG: hypothetical protein ABI325_11765 [Ginsengibacter sp.]
MKTVKNYPFSFLLTMFICVFISCRKDAASLCENGSCAIVKPTDTYDYPVKGGTPEWAAFTTHQQMEDACQVPADTLAKMSTDGLIQTCMDYPLLGDLLLNVGVNITGALSNMMQTFSGLIELCERTDAGTAMLERYKIMNPDCATCNQPIFTSNFNAFEMVIGNDSIQKKMTSNENKTLVKEATNKYRQKKNIGNYYYALYGLSTSLYVCSKVMLNENYQPFVQLYKQDYNLQLFVAKLLWPADPNEANIMFNKILATAITFPN